MAATGYTPISLYYSTTASAVPTAGNLANGELALNIADMKLYAKNSAGTVTLLASNSGASGTVSSVAVSGGTTGLTTSGGPITTSGTITLAGTLNVANGGTGLTSLTAGYIPYGNGTSAFASSSSLFFDGTNLGIGTSSPATRLDIVKASTGDVATFTGTGGAKGYLNVGGTTVSIYDSSAGAGNGIIFGSAGTSAVRLQYGGTVGVTLDSAGNLGLGVTPSAWYSPAKVFQIGNGLSLWSSANTNANLSQNLYLDATATYRWITANPATNFSQNNGAFTWQLAAGTPTAGGAIGSFNTYMTLDASGNLVVGATTNVNSRKLSVNGIISVQDGTSEQAFIYYTGSATQWVSSSTPQQFWVNGAQRFVFGTSGQFGIGATPDYGTTGQVLTSQGSGSAPTWAAPSSGGGATAQYSIVGNTGLTGGQSWTNIAFNPSDITTGNYATVSANLYYFSATEVRPISIKYPRWSSYYQRWYGVGPYNNSIDYAIYFSKDGLNWYPVVYDLAARSGYASVSYADTQSNVAIDDSNGRIFLAWVDAGVLTVGYTSITSTTNNNSGTWTNTTISPGGTIELKSMQYMKMATTGASGIVLAFKSSTTSNRDGYIYTCSDGSTTWTQRLSFTAANTLSSFALFYEENGKIFAPTNTTTAAYTTSGNITSGWTTGTAPANVGAVSCVGNGYFCFFDGATLYYSTTGATGSWTSVSAGVSAGNLFYTGSVFIALDSPSGSGVQTIRTTATNTPITWSALNGGANINKTFSIQGTFGQRMTAA